MQTRRTSPSRLGKPGRPRTRPWRVLGLILALTGLVAACLAWRQYTRPGAAHSRAGQEALSAQRPADAEQEWLQGIKEDPTSADCYVQLGDLYMAQKRYPEAVAKYGDASRLSPQDGWLFVKLTQAELAVGDKKAAEAAAKRAAALLPDNADAWGLYGLIEQDLFNQPDALAALRRAHELRPTDRDYLLGLVRTEANNINLPQAERDLAPYLKAHSDDPMACHLMSYLYQQKPRTPDTLQTALNYELKARIGMPDDLRVLIGLGDIYLDMNRNQEALRVYQDGLKRHPDSEEMLHGLVNSNTRLGRTSQAASYAARLQALASLHQRISHLKDVLKDAPANVVAGLELGRLQEQDGNDAAAHATYAFMVRQAPQDSRTRLALAGFFRRHGSPNLARQALQPNYVP